MNEKNNPPAVGQQGGFGEQLNHFMIALQQEVPQPVGVSVRYQHLSTSGDLLDCAVKEHALVDAVTTLALGSEKELPANMRVLLQALVAYRETKFRWMQSHCLTMNYQP